LPASFQPHKALHFNFTPYSAGQNPVALNSSENCPQMKPALIKPISIKDMPFFCRMECKARNRANIWIKLRAGDDDSYMKMIRGSLER
jgi:hypothetical protein